MPQPQIGSPAARGARVVVASNRGPISFALGDDGAIVMKRAAGGMVVALGPGVVRSGALWVASALSDADRRAARAAEDADGPGAIIEAQGFRLRSLVLERAEMAGHGDVVANSSLWYLLHGLWDLPRRPRFDKHWHAAWKSYRSVNRRFADAISEVAPAASTILVQDYQLALVAGMLATTRTDLHLATFIHTPWCSPEEFAVLPDDVAAELVSTMVAGGPCGFHSARWATRFEACAAGLGGSRAKTFVAPAASDLDDLRAVASSKTCEDELAQMNAALGERQFIVRVDRIELSKNILRGLWAFDEMLERNADLVGNVTFGMYLYPSRLGLADYQALGQEIATLVAYINARWASDGWTPVVLDTDDNHPRSVAALRRYDVLLVNPVRDGLNLVALEGPPVNERDGAVILSRQAGCFDSISAAVTPLNPFDVSATADALAAALRLGKGQRQERAAALRKAIAARTPISWWDELVARAETERS